MAMSSGASRDVILRASVMGMFHVLDSMTLELLAGPLPRNAALTFARRHGAKTVYHQPVDSYGRILGVPVHLATID
jgi:hypothetical protein